MADEINVPSLVLVLVVSGFLIRHFFFRGSPQANGEHGTSAASARGAGGQSRDQRRAEALDRRTEAAVEHIQQIFPYADRREVWWDLRRNGINVAATTERILAGRLDTPPITFQPPMPPARPNAGASAGASGSASGAAAGAAASSTTTTRPGQPSLIQRYHLENKLAETPKADTASSSSVSSASSPSAAASILTNTKAKNWSSNRDERQTLLQKRRDDMIIEARRKMEAKIAAEKEAAASGNAKSA
ncbi:hypothetical protein SCUCBS95973_004359 [Sporothrix curviconia]|uniref:CUE domain-containing protein n=1 Tax=Sporothrix curviconia TaxID=1260050 RepID=A0ABP0BN27_9PEZI